MTIDWLTVGAQVVNFLVLVYLLKRFLYGRVVRAMDRREAAIAERIAQADRRNEEAERQAQGLREERAALQAQRERLLTRAGEDAAELRRRLEEELRQEIDHTRARWREQLEREQAAFLRDVRRLTVEQFQALSRRALADLAGADLEARMAQALVRRLGQLDGAHRAALLAAAGREPLLVRSASELADDVKQALTEALRRVGGPGVEVRFERAPDLACGVELRGAGQSVAWSLDGYLDALERRLADGVAAPGAVR